MFSDKQHLVAYQQSVKLDDIRGVIFSKWLKFIEIGYVVWEHGLCCIDFWWFWTNLVHLM